MSWEQILKIIDRSSDLTLKEKAFVTKTYKSVRKKLNPLPSPEEEFNNLVGLVAVYRMSQPRAI